MKRTRARQAEPSSTDSLSVVNLADTSAVEYADRSRQAALSVAVRRALKGSTHRPYGYLLAAPLMNTSSLSLAQGFPASVNLSDLDGSGCFVIIGGGVMSAQALFIILPL